MKKKISYHISFHLGHGHDDDHNDGDGDGDGDLHGRCHDHDHVHHRDGHDGVKDFEKVGVIVRVHDHDYSNFHVDDVYQYLQVKWVLSKSFELKELMNQHERLNLNCGYDYAHDFQTFYGSGSDPDNENDLHLHENDHEHVRGRK